MASENQLNIDIIINDKEALAKLRSALKDVETNAHQSSEAMSSGFLTAAAATGAAIIAIHKLIDVMSQAISAASEQEEALNRLNTSMRLQGTLTDGLSEHYQDLASELQKSSRFADEAILMVQQRLITIGNVGPSQMEKATRASLDLAAALHIDLETASTMVARAAAGQTTALERQLPILKELITENTTFSEILTILNDKFGGSAKSDVETYAGAQDKLKNSIGEVLEELGNFVVKSPEVTAAMQKMSEGALNMAASLRKIREEDPHALMKSFTEFMTQSLPTLVSQGPMMGGAMLAGKAAGKTLVEQIFGTAQENAKAGADQAKAVQDTAAKALQVQKAIALDSVKVKQAEAKAKHAAMVAQFKEDIQVAQATADLVNAVAVLSGKSSVKAVAIVLQAVVTAVNIMMTTVNPFLALLKIATTAVSAAASLQQLSQAERALDAAREQSVTAVTNVPGFAGGVRNFGGGLALVGERGPELVNLPSGSDVIPNGQFGGTQINITLNNPVITTEESARGIARVIAGHVSEFIENERQRL